MNCQNEVKVKYLWETGMHIIKYFYTPNIVDLLHIVLEKQAITQKLHFDHWTMKMRSRSDDTCQLDMYTLQSFHTPNILDLLLIVSEIWTWPPKVNLVHGSMKWGRGQVKFMWRAWGPWYAHTKYSYPITHNKRQN